jgi:hypothetical protein
MGVFRISIQVAQIEIGVVRRKVGVVRGEIGMARKNIGVVRTTVYLIRLNTESSRTRSVAEPPNSGPNRGDRSRLGEYRGSLEGH